jgi:hypothetical protein
VGGEKGGETGSINGSVSAPRGGEDAGKIAQDYERTLVKGRI